MLFLTQLLLHFGICEALQHTAVASNADARQIVLFVM